MGFQIQIWPILLVFLVDFGKVLCSSANELQENSNASSREDYIPQILAVLFEILPPGGGAGGTPIHYLYGCVPPNGVVILKLLI